MPSFVAVFVFALPTLLLGSPSSSAYDLYVATDRDAWVKKFSVDEKGTVVETAKASLRNPTGLAVLDDGVLVSTADSDLVLLDRQSLETVRTKRVAQLPSSVAIWAIGNVALVQGSQSTSIVSSALEEVAKIESVASASVADRALRAVINQPSPCAPPNDIPCFSPALYLADVSANGSVANTRTLAVPWVPAPAASSPEAFWNGDRAGLIVNGMAAGKGGAVAIQKSLVVDLATGKSPGSWEQSYTQAKSGHGYQVDDLGTAVVSTLSTGTKAWGIARRGPSFVLVSLNAAGTAIEIGKSRLDLGVETYDAPANKADTATRIGTMTPLIHMRAHDEQLVIAIDHVLLVVDVSASPRVLSRTLFRGGEGQPRTHKKSATMTSSGSGYTVQVTGLDVR